MSFDFPVISADSHITEPPDCYTATSTRRSVIVHRTWSTTTSVATSS